MPFTWRLAILFFFTLALLPFLSRSQDGGGAQQTQQTPTVTTPAPAIEPVVPDPAKLPAQSPGQSQQSLRDHFRSCDKALSEALNQVRSLSHDAREHFSYSREALHRQHVQVQEQIKALKEGHEQFVGDLTAEQRNSVQNHIETMKQLHDRILVHLETIDKEFTGPDLHLTIVADEARDAERDMKSYQKHLQETGKAFNLLND